MKKYESLFKSKYYSLFCIATFLGMLAYIMKLKKRLSNLKEVERKDSVISSPVAATCTLLLLWIEHKIKGDQISSYFIQHGIQRIAIYGMGEVGTLLYYELFNSEIDIVCGIDKNKDKDIADLKVLKPEEFVGNADVVIVTPIYYFSEIYDDLHMRLNENVKILGLDEILYAL